MNRDSAVAQAQSYFDSGAFREDLARRVAMPTESQNPDQASTLIEYLEAKIKPTLKALGFVCHVLSEGKWPFLLAATLPAGNDARMGAIHEGDDQLYMAGMSIVAGLLQVLNSGDSFRA